MIENYIFDFDATLADSKQCSVLATKKAFKQMNLPEPSVETIEYYMGIPIEQSFKNMSNKELSNMEFEELLETFRQAYKEVEQHTLTVFPFIPEVLQKLKRSGAKLFVVSSKKTDVLLRNLQSLQIAEYFDDWIGSDQVTHYKPDPEGIQKIVQQYHLNVENTVMIGDAIFDIQMGQAARCNTCAVTWGSHSKEMLLKEQPTFLIDHVQTLLQLKVN